MDLILGFSGTRFGMSTFQKQQLYDYLHLIIAGDDNIESFHHGCCVGADVEADSIVRKFRKENNLIDTHKEAKSKYGNIRGNLTINLHPPVYDKYRASIVHDAQLDTLHPNQPYLTRDIKIVEMCNVLIAAPLMDKKPAGNLGNRQGGTWFTINRAKEIGRAVVMLRRNEET